MNEYVETVKLPNIVKDTRFISQNFGNKLKVKRLTETAKLPVKANQNDAGFDIFAERGALVFKTKVSTGLSIEIPDGYYGRLTGRSGLTSKTPLRVQEGTIDAGYRGEIKVICDVKSKHKICDEGGFAVDADGFYAIETGDKIAQLIIQPLPAFEIEEVDELTETDRGANGFGSTGV